MPKLTTEDFCKIAEYVDRINDCTKVIMDTLQKAESDPKQTVFVPQDHLVAHKDEELETVDVAFSPTVNGYGGGGEYINGKCNCFIGIGHEEVRCFLAKLHRSNHQGEFIHGGMG